MMIGSSPELARRQHGVISREQLARAGVGKTAVSARLRTGRLHRIHAGVYSVGHRLLSRQGWWMAAVLASGSEALLSHHTAAALWGIRGYSGGVIHVIVPHKRLTEEPGGRKRSKLEDRFAPFLRRHRLPLPRFNDWIFLDDKRYRVDCHWPDLRRIVELDGWEGHRTRSAFREDRARDRALTAAGFSVTRLTWNQLDDEPEAVASDLRRLLSAES